MRYFFIPLLLSLLISCKATEKTTFSAKYVNNYNNGIRWRRFEDIRALLGRDNDIKYLSIKDKYNNVTIEGFKIISIKRLGMNRYKVLLERNEMILPSNILKMNRYYEYWNFDTENKAWFLKDEIKMEL